MKWHPNNYSILHPWLLNVSFSTNRHQKENQINESAKWEFSFWYFHQLKVTHSKMFKKNLLQVQSSDVFSFLRGWKMEILYFIKNDIRSQMQKKSFSYFLLIFIIYSYNITKNTFSMVIELKKLYFWFCFITFFSVCLII